MLLKLRGFAGSALKAVGLLTVADKVEGLDDKTSWFVFGGIGALILLLLKGK